MKGSIYSIIVLTGLLLLEACTGNSIFETGKPLDYCRSKSVQTLNSIPDTCGLPQDIGTDGKHWNCSSIYTWTSGFWPGSLWYLYEYSGDTSLLTAARHWTACLEPVKTWDNKNHDIGFMMYCSFGNGYRLTGDSLYKSILLESADSLVSLFNPKAGTILSWPWFRRDQGWNHNTIIDNMMNLELLFWAAKNGRPQYADIAAKHAETTMKNHIRNDFSTWHVLGYDSLTGSVLHKITAQGYSDSSMWARGQAWAIYGFTVAWRETGRDDFKLTALKLANAFTSRLPDDHVPYWDFDAPEKETQPRDASAAAIASSALLEMASLISDPALRAHYYNEARIMLEELSKNYYAGDQNDALLLHSVGSKPANSEVDYSIIYADYYYIEALLRIKKIQEKYPQICNE
jgi:unsaturated chondroitin disaccharide hydrolase